MTDKPRNAVGIWDRDCPKWEMHYRGFIKALPAPHDIPTRVGRRDEGRYALILTAVGFPHKAYTCADSVVLDSSLRSMLMPSKFQSGVRIYVVGLKDTVQIIEAVAAAWRAGSVLPIEVLIDEPSSSSPAS